MQLRDQWILICFIFFICFNVGKEECSELRKWSFLVFFSRKSFFILFDKRGLQTEMFKIMKAEQFLVFLAV